MPGFISLLHPVPVLGGASWVASSNAGKATFPHSLMPHVLQSVVLHPFLQNTRRIALSQAQNPVVALVKFPMFGECPLI